MMYEKNESRKCSTELSVYEKNRQEKKMNNAKKTHKSITTMLPLTSDAMSSNNSEDKQNNAVTKMGRQGFTSKDNYQSRRKSSQGKGDHLRRD
jgi:hypothetical protein